MTKTISSLKPVEKVTIRSVHLSTLEVSECWFVRTSLHGGYLLFERRITEVIPKVGSGSEPSFGLVK